MKRLKKFREDHPKILLVGGTAFLLGALAGVVILAEKQIHGMEVIRIGVGEDPDGKRFGGVFLRNGRELWTELLPVDPPEAA